MPACARFLLLGLVAACAAAPETPLPVSRPELATAPPAEPSPEPPAQPAPGAPIDVQRELALLCAEERHRDALAMVDLALQQHPGSEALRFARAGLLRDLGRRADAAAELRRVDQSANGLPPPLRLELAELQWLNGDRAAAAQQLDRLDAELGRRSELAALRDASQQLRLDLRLEGGARRLRVRDLLGDLRGAGAVASRQLAFTRLCDVGGEVAERAALIALADADGTLRAQALSLVQAEAGLLGELLGAALDDEHTMVRTVAARRTAAMPAEAAVPLLFAALAREADASVFATLDRELGQRLAAPAGVAPITFDTETVRQQRVEAWRPLCLR